MHIGIFAFLQRCRPDSYRGKFGMTFQSFNPSLIKKGLNLTAVAFFKENLKNYL